MRRQRLFIPGAELGRQNINDRKVVHKLKNVLRKRAGENILVFDGRGKEYSALIESIGRDKVKVNIIEILREQCRKQPLIYLAFSLVKSLKAELLLRMCTEAGADGFVPFISRNSVAVVKDFLSKRQRFEEIVLQACSQSRRLYVPEVKPIVDFPGLLERVNDYSLCFAAGPYAHNWLKPSDSFLDKKNLLIVVGPEGGLTGEEESALSDKGACLVKISDFILRVETAAVAAVCLAAAGGRQ